MFYLNKSSFLLWLFIGLSNILLYFSCNNRQNLPEKVRQAIENSGNNKSEIYKIIDHYKAPKDSLKLKAAYFLIDAINGRYVYRGKLLDEYSQYSMLVKRDIWHGEYIFNSLNALYGPFSYDKLSYDNELQFVKADSIISNIDFALKVWNEVPWHTQYSFKIFCEDVLPFSISDEIPSFNREQVYRIFSPLITSVIKNHGSAEDAAYIINEKLKKDGWALSIRMSLLPHFGPESLIRYRIGNCRDMSDCATDIMRDLGIPVGNDFTPQYPNRRLGHNWNILFMPNGETIKFLGTEDSPGIPHQAGVLLGKIYRYTVSANKESLGAQEKPGEIVPAFLDDPYIKDVTKLYGHSVNVTIPLNPHFDHKHVYLAVYNDKNWVPLAWTAALDSKACFKDVEPGVVYLPVSFDASGITPIGTPFILNENGSRTDFNSGNGNTIDSLKLIQVSEPIAESYDLNSLIGGYFEGADSANFSDAVCLYQVTTRNKPHIYMNTVQLRSNFKFRYFRYCVKRQGYSDGNLSEMAVFYKRKKLPVKVFSGKSEQAGDPFGPEKVIDNDFTTDFLAKGRKSSEWVAFDFGRETPIDQINFAAGMHDGGQNLWIKSGHKYELSYWNKNQWKVLDTQTAANPYLIFKRLPENNLYFIHDLSAAVDERIFSIRNGSIKWF